MSRDEQETDEIVVVQLTITGTPESVGCFIQEGLSNADDWCGELEVVGSSAADQEQSVRCHNEYLKALGLSEVTE